MITILIVGDEGVARSARAAPRRRARVHPPPFLLITKLLAAISRPQPRRRLSTTSHRHAVCPLPDDTRYVKDLEGALRGLLHTRTLLHFQTAKASLPDYCAARRGGCSAPATATAQQIVRVDVSAPSPGAARRPPGFHLFDSHGSAP